MQFPTVLLALLFLLAATATASPQAEVILEPADMARPADLPPMPDELAGIETSEVGVLKLWFERQRLLEQGDVEGAKQAVVGILDLMERGGIRGMSFLAGALSHEGARHLRGGDPLRAMESFQLALLFDPGLPSAHFGLANARRQAGHGFLTFAKDMAGGLRASLGNFWWTYLKLGNAFLWVLLTVSTLGMAFAVLMFLRYHAPWRHGLFEWFRDRRVPPGMARLLGTATAVLPLLFWIGGPWLLLYWLVGTFRYMRAGEKTIAVALLLFALIATPAFALALNIYQMTANDTFRATVSATRGGYEPEKVKYIQQVLEQRPDDLTVRFLLAAQLKDGGYFLQAFEHYKKVLDLDPDNHRAFNNMGNIYFATQQYGQGIHYYRRAAEARPGFVLAYFNTYLAQKEQFHFSEAERSLGQARTLNAEQVAHLMERAGGEGAVTPVDAKIPMQEVWMALVRESSATPLRYPGSFVTASGFVNPVSLAAAAALLLLGLVAFLGRGEPARGCDRCGRGFCRRCSESMGPVELCAQCSLLFVQREATDPRARLRKQRQITLYQWAVRIGRRLVGMLLPGTGHLLSGRTYRGIALLLGWCFVGLHLLLNERLLDFPGRAVEAGPGPLTWVAVALLALVWLAGNLVRLPKFR